MEAKSTCLETRQIGMFFHLDQGFNRIIANAARGLELDLTRLYTPGQPRQKFLLRSQIS
jgi:hypothetical protein